MEIGCYRKMLRISCQDRVTNEAVHDKIQQAIEPREDLLTVAKRRKLPLSGHVSRSSGLAKTILQGTVNGGRRQNRGRGGKTTTGNVVRQVPEGSGEQGKMKETGCKIICGAPTTLAVKG